MKTFRISMEVVRTVVPIAILALQFVILMELHI